MTDIDIIEQLQQATLKVEALDNMQISALKAYATPSESHKYVLAAFQILFEIKDLSYEASVRMLADNFKSKILKYDKSNIPIVTLKKLELYIQSKHFDQESLIK